MIITDLITRERIVCDIDVTSKKAGHRGDKRTACYGAG